MVTFLRKREKARIRLTKTEKGLKKAELSQWTIPPTQEPWLQKKALGAISSSPVTLIQFPGRSEPFFYFLVTTVLAARSSIWATTITKLTSPYQIPTMCQGLCYMLEIQRWLRPRALTGFSNAVSSSQSKISTLQRKPKQLSSTRWGMTNRTWMIAIQVKDSSSPTSPQYFVFLSLNT